MTLSASLTMLTEALDTPDLDLATEVAALAADVRHAIPSYIGMTLTAPTDITSLTLTIPPRPWTPLPRSSLQMALSPDPELPRVDIAFYAAATGAFVDLGADLAFALGLNLTDIAIDQHLTPATPIDRDDPHTPLDVPALSTINQAIGVLIDRGYPPRHAHAALTRHAATAGLTLAAAAHLILVATPHRGSNRP